MILHPVLFPQQWAPSWSLCLRTEKRIDLHGSFQVEAMGRGRSQGLSYWELPLIAAAPPWLIPLEDAVKANIIRMLRTFSAAPHPSVLIKQRLFPISPHLPILSILLYFILAPYLELVLPHQWGLLSPFSFTDLLFTNPLPHRPKPFSTTCHPKLSLTIAVLLLSTSSSGALWHFLSHPCGSCFTHRTALCQPVLPASFCVETASLLSDRLK